MSPTRYRQFGRVTPQISVAGRPDEPGGPAAAVCGTIWSATEDRPVFAGLFPGRILQGRPVRCTVMRGSGPYVLPDVPLGSWHLLAQSTPFDGQDAGGAASGGDEGLYVGNAGPIVIRPGAGTRVADIRLRPIHRLDPPVLLALGDLEPLVMSAG